MKHWTEQGGGCYEVLDFSCILIDGMFTNTQPGINYDMYRCNSRDKNYCISWYHLLPEFFFNLENSKKKLKTKILYIACLNHVNPWISTIVSVVKDSVVEFWINTYINQT